MGHLMGEGPVCRVSIFKNDNIPSPFFFFFFLSIFRKPQCPISFSANVLSLILNPQVAYQFFLNGRVALSSLGVRSPTNPPEQHGDPRHSGKVHKVSVLLFHLIEQGL